MFHIVISGAGCSQVVLDPLHLEEGELSALKQFYLLSGIFSFLLKRLVKLMLSNIRQGRDGQVMRR